MGILERILKYLKLPAAGCGRAMGFTCTGYVCAGEPLHIAVFGTSCRLIGNQTVIVACGQCVFVCSRVPLRLCSYRLSWVRSKQLKNVSAL